MHAGKFILTITLLALISVENVVIL